MPGEETTPTTPASPESSATTVIEDQDHSLEHGDTSGAPLDEFNKEELDDLFGPEPGKEPPKHDRSESASTPPVSGEEEGGTQTPGPESRTTTPEGSGEGTSTEASPGETPAASESEDEVKALRAEALRMAELLAKHGIVAQAEPPATTPAPGTTEPPAATTPPPKPAEMLKVELKEIDFVGEEKIDDIIETKEGLNKLLNSVRKQAVEHTLASVPGLVNQVASQMIGVHLAVQDFYSANQDLLAYKPYVGHVSHEVAAKNPTFTLPQVLQETAKQVRDRLRLKGTAATTTPPPTPGRKPSATPGLPGARSAPRQPAASKPSDLSQEIIDLM